MLLHCGACLCISVHFAELWCSFVQFGACCCILLHRGLLGQYTSTNAASAAAVAATADVAASGANPGNPKLNSKHLQITVASQAKLLKKKRSPRRPAVKQGPDL